MRTRARTGAWEIWPLQGTFPYSDLHTYLVRLKFRLHQNAYALLGKGRWGVAGTVKPLGDGVMWGPRFLERLPPASSQLHKNKKKMYKTN